MSFEGTSAILLDIAASCLLPHRYSPLKKKTHWHAAECLRLGPRAVGQKRAHQSTTCRRRWRPPCARWSSRTSGGGSAAHTGELNIPPLGSDRKPRSASVTLCYCEKLKRTLECTTETSLTPIGTYSLNEISRSGTLKATFSAFWRPTLCFIKIVCLTTLQDYFIITSQINLIFRNFYAIFPKFSAISYLVSPHAYPQLFLISDTLKRISLNSMRLKRNVLKIIRAKKKNVFKTKKSR